MSSNPYKGDDKPKYDPEKNVRKGLAQKPWVPPWTEEEARAADERRKKFRSAGADKSQGEDAAPAPAEPSKPDWMW